MTEQNRYRVLKYYNMFFAHWGNKLQIRRKFLWWEWWDTIQEDSLGINGYDWTKHYGCEIVGGKDDRAE